MQKILNVIIAFPFGFPQGILPNVELAKISQDEAEKNCAALFVHNDLPIAEKENIFIFGGKSTLGFIKEIIISGLVEPGQKIMVVAAPPHSSRCVRDLRKCGFNAVAIKGFEKRFTDDFWFSKQSLQFWTRYEFAWRFREACIGLMPWMVYEKLSP